ncbi:MAG: branched-chain amino acid ABC transporter permease [Lachnospiraceae bacterium]|jgi:branched-chain amino acid transport system permease protein
MKKILKIGKDSRKAFITYGIVIAGYIVMQILSSTGSLSSMLQGMLVPICAYVTMAVSLNLTVGILGELSLGHAGFMSAGAFSGVTAAVCLSGIQSPSLRLALAMIIAALFAGVIGFIIGIPVLRLNGDYLAIVTLAFGEIIKSIFNNLFVGIDSRGLHFSFLNDNTHLEEGGKLIIGGPMGLGSIDKISTFTAGVILVIISLIIVFNFVKSRTGRAVMAIRDNKIAAESVGINITSYKMMAFVTSAAIAGAAGALFAMNYSTIVANKFDFNTSILVLVFVVLGGLGNMLGSIIAATALTILPEALRQFSDYRMLVYAIVLILVMIVTNNPTIKDFFKRFRKKDEDKEGGAA